MDCRVHRSFFKRGFLFPVIGVFLGASAAFGQVETNDLDQLSASGLLGEASRLLAAEQINQAVPFLKGYLARMQDTDDARVLALIQEVRLKLAKINIYQANPEEAVDYLKAYLSNRPCYKPREALKLLAVKQSELAHYQECVAAAQEALTRPQPRELIVEEQAVSVEDLSEEELGGFTTRQMKRFEEMAAESDDLTAGISSNAPEPEPDYTLDELLLLHMTLAEAYTALEDWESSLEHYRFVIDQAEQGDRRGVAAMKMVSALIRLERAQQAASLVADLYETDLRYELRFNMALMKAADALVEQQEYARALVLYRMVIPRQQIVDYQAVQMNKIRRKTGLPDVNIRIVTNRAGRIQTLFGDQFAQISTEEDDAEGSLSLPPKPQELLQLEERAGAVMSFPPYEQEVIYRTGQLFAESGRPWEAVVALRSVAEHNPDGEMGQRAFYESLQILTDPLEEYAQVETLGRAFLEKYRAGLGPRQVAHALTGAFQRQEKMEAIKELLPIIQRFKFSDDPIVRQVECELYYMQAVADMVLLNYRKAEAGFRYVLTEFPDSHQEDNTSYWHAMSLLFLQNYDEALAEFEAYQQDFPDGNWQDTVDFRRGICLFGLERYEEAEACFTKVIHTYEDSRVYPDACSMRGDLLAAKGQLDQAQADYEEAFKTAHNPRQAGYATFQMASMFELEERYDEILSVVHAYLERYGEEADVAKAAYWVGKTKLAQGLTGEAVSAYLEAIVEYGDHVSQDGVDLIINELVNMSRRQLTDDEIAALKSNLKAARQAAENQTLDLRLRVLLAKLNGTELALGKELIAELDDLTQAPPPVLGIICDASFEEEDYSRAKEMFELFLTRFEESEFMRSAYKLRAYDLFAANDLAGAMNIVEDAQALYGTEPDVAWAQLLKGRIELEQGNVAAARETFRAVLTVRAWRGVPYAKATLALGETEEAAGNPVRAFGWYQRVYSLYKAYDDGYWAAEAYLASARCLRKMGRENDRRNTFRAMLFDKYVNTLPQADAARAALGADEVMEINRMLAAGSQTNITVTVDAEGTE